ncbi:hypothetical protein BDW71DRAFT_171505 [Aspergillus fruticulosus]
MHVGRVISHLILISAFWSGLDGERQVSWPLQGSRLSLKSSWDGRQQSRLAESAYNVRAPADSDRVCLLREGLSAVYGILQVHLRVACFGRIWLSPQLFLLVFPRAPISIHSYSSSLFLKTATANSDGA